MSTQGKVSLPVIKRLPKYYRYLNNMQRSGITKEQMATMQIEE